MKSVVSGVAGAVRIQQLTIAGLTRAEGHGKREDKTGKSRAINEEPAIATDGLDLKSLYQAHVRGAFVPRAGSKAMHVIVQFPKDLVDGADAERMLHHAREFGKRVFGDQAIFADRIDRDEKSQHVVDLFVAPKYEKKTKLQAKLAVSMSRHLKLLAKKHGHQSNPFGIGRALQDELFEYLRDEMRLEKVQRGAPKVAPGSDWKSAEQLRVEELEELNQRLNERERQLHQREERQIDGWARLASLIEEAKKDAEKIRSEAEAGVRLARAEADAETQRILEAAKREGLEQGLAAARDQIKFERDEVAAKNCAADKDREAAAAQLATASAQRAATEVELLHAKDELSNRSAGLDLRERAIAEKERRAAQASATATALQSGIQAWAAGDIVGTEGTHFVFRDEATKGRILPAMLPALNEIWDAVTSLGTRAAERFTAIEAEANQKANRLIKEAEEANAKAGALNAGIEAWAGGDILNAGRFKDGRPGILWRDEAAKQRLEPSIMPAWKEVWRAVAKLSSRAAEKVRAIEADAKDKARILTDAVQAASVFLKQYENANGADRDKLRSTEVASAVSSFVRDPAVGRAVANSTDEHNAYDVLMAAAGGFAKGVVFTGTRAGRNS